MSTFVNPTILKILDYYKNIWALSYVSGVTYWDLETYMPKMGATARGEALGRLSVISQKIFLDKEFVSLISKADKEKLNDAEKGVVRTLKRSLDFYQKVPADFLEEFEKLTNTGTVIWREAKEKNNYQIFEKTLSKIFDMNKKLAEYLSYKSSPYDALLNLYEADLTSSEVTEFFNVIRSPLQELLKKIISSDKYIKVHELEKTKYDQKLMSELNDKIIKTFWKEKDRFRTDVSSHPFTISFGNNDTRITTWYHDTDFARSLLATIHEFGHALYDLQSRDELEMTPISGGSSLVIHESQSRFWENFVGRSEDFIKYFLSDFKNVTRKKNLKEEDVYLYFNKVSPGFLRVEADEVTYHFHIMIRAEIERDILEGKLKVKDLKEVWDQKMKSYLGIKPVKDSLGILQDIHWSGGSIGYFPTYSLGTFLGAQWEDQMNVKNNIKDIETIKETLKNKIHKFGGTYTLDELLKKNKMKFDPSVNLGYLVEKYTKIYNLK